MLTDAFVTLSAFVRGLYPTMYNDDPATNRVLTIDDEKRLLELAVNGPVVQLYPPSYRRDVIRCTFEIAAPTADAAMRLADEAYAALKPSTRHVPVGQDPEIVPIKGTQHARMQVSFTLDDF